MRRIITIHGQRFDWPEHQTRPSSFAISERQYAGYLARTRVPVREASKAECDAALAANEAGPRGRHLSAEELVYCYRNEAIFRRCNAEEGVLEARVPLTA